MKNPARRAYNRMVVYTHYAEDARTMTATRPEGTTHVLLQHNPSAGEGRYHRLTVDGEVDGTLHGAEYTLVYFRDVSGELLPVSYRDLTEADGDVWHAAKMMTIQNTHINGYHPGMWPLERHFQDGFCF